MVKYSPEELNPLNLRLSDETWTTRSLCQLFDTLCGIYETFSYLESAAHSQENLGIKLGQLMELFPLLEGQDRNQDLDKKSKKKFKERGSTISRFLPYRGYDGLEIQRIDIGTPNKIELLGIGDAIRAVGELVERLFLIGKKRRQFDKEAAVNEVELRAMEAEIESKLIKNSIEEIALVQQAIEVYKEAYRLTGRNPEDVKRDMKILLESNLYPHLERLVKFESTKKILPPEDSDDDPTQ